LHIGDLLQLKFLGIIFTFVLVALFDNSGTMIAVLHQANLIKAHGEIPRLSRVLATDSIATMCASWLGVSSLGNWVRIYCLCCFGNIDSSMA
jgi:AGZA family xanthine/uracil permease-like MFS transporter